MKRLLSLVVLLALTIAPIAAFAQDGPELTEEFTSEDGLFSMSYPEGWVVEENTADLPFPGAVLANSEETLAAFNDPDVEGPESGMQAVLLFVFPADFFGLMGMEMPEEPTIVDIANLFGTLFMTPEGGEVAPEATEEPMAEATEMATPEAEEIELGEDMTAGYVEVSDDVSQGALVVRDLGEGLYAVAYAVTAPDEFDEDFAALAQAVAATVSYGGTAEDVMNAMMATPASLDGNALVDERCTVCHTRERIDSQDKDEAGWTATVDRMIGYGAQLDSSERQAVIDYLVETH
jgi:hypothetical protein